MKFYSGILKQKAYRKVNYIIRIVLCYQLKTVIHEQIDTSFLLLFCLSLQNDPFKNDVRRTSINYPLKQQRLDKCSNGCLFEELSLLKYKSLSNIHKVLN